MTVGVLVDLTKCIGCSSCTVACKMYNGNKWVDNRSPASGEKAVLADENWTVIQKHIVPQHPSSDNEPKEVWRFVKRQCLHCQEPGCVSSCFARAFHKTEEGPVIYYPHNCVGCRYCMLACPFSVPKFEWNKTIPVLTKCMLCAGKLKKGELPACVSACPTNVMKFGERDVLLAEAKKIVAEDSRYVKYIYGEEEAGGTSWLYISDKPFEQLGFNMNVPKKPITRFSTKYTHLTPLFGAVWGIILTGLYFITKRRSKVKANAKKETEKKEN